WMRAVVATALALSLATSAGTASAIGLGVGVFGGASWPIVQDDVSSGSQFGVRIPLHLIPLLTIEPYYARTMLGDVTKTFGGAEYTRSGFDIDSFGVTAALGGVGLAAGIPFYPYAGIASNKLTRTGSPDETDTGYTVGFGFGVPLPLGIAVTARAGLTIIVTGDTSRKTADLHVGDRKSTRLHSSHRPISHAVF